MPRWPRESSRYFEQYQSTPADPPGASFDSFSKSLLSQDVAPGFHGLAKYPRHHCRGPSGAALADGAGAGVIDCRICRAPVRGDRDSRADPVASTLGADADAVAVFTGGAPIATWAAF